MQNALDSRFSIVVADSHPLFRHGLLELLEADGYCVAGSVGSTEELFELVRRKPPNLILFDVDLPGEEAVTLVGKLTADFPRVKLLAYGMQDNPRVVWRLISLGIRGFLLKTVSRIEMLSAVRAIHDDDDRIILSISRKIISAMHAGPSSSLTDRENEVITLVSEAMTNAQIARSLAITEGTVKRHLRNIYRKLGAVSRVDAVNKAAQAVTVLEHADAKAGAAAGRSRFVRAPGRSASGS